MQPMERRQTRSDIPSEATRLFCESMAKRLHARALVLASEDGLTVSGAGSSDELDLLAALAVIHPSQISSMTRENEPTYTLPMRIDGTYLMLASIGGEPPKADEACAAVERILFHAA